VKRKVSRRPVVPGKRRPGKAGKRKTLRVVVPKVGDVVAITWVDSGLGTHRDSTPHKDLDLAVITTYGMVMFADAKKVVIAAEYERDDPGDIGTMMRNVVWTKSITGVDILRRAGRKS